MNVVVSVEHRFDRTPDGSVWTQTMFAHSFWLRYLSAFEQVRVVARVRDVPSVPPEWQRANGAGVSFTALPYYIGPAQYALQARQVQRAARRAIGPRDAVIMRVGSQIAACMVPMLRRTKHPYGLQVVGDPYDVFAPGSVRHPLSPFFRQWFFHQLRSQCQAACAVAYVTDQALQRRYPAATNALSTSYSDVDLSDAAFVAAPCRPRQNASTIQIVTVGSLAQLYKGPDVLIDAVGLCLQQGLDLRLVFVGDGKYRPELEASVAARGLERHICFRGQLTAGASVRTELDQADVFVLPSKTEGLPRAMIEAMARSLPCIGSMIGGIPELLPPEDLVPPGDAVALARTIRDVATNPQRMARMSARNLEKARGYHEHALQERRSTFYHYVKERTAAWQLAQGHH